MAKVAAEAVIRSIRELARLDLSSSEAAALEAFLTAKRLAVIGGEVSINTVNKVVDELFNVLPEHPMGRIYPFDRNAELAGVAPKWRVSFNSGRKTVWNMTTRKALNFASQLFQEKDIRAGLLPDAAQKLGQQLDPRPNAQALTVFLLRNEEFDAPPTASSLDDRLAEKFGLQQAELLQFCSPGTLGVPLSGDVEWAPEQLPSELRPHDNPAATIPVPIVSNEAELILDERVRRMVRLAIASSRAVMLVGPPGTGKTALLNEVIEEIKISPSSYGFAHEIADPLWQTPEESWSTRELLGGDTIVDGALRFRPGLVLDAIAQDRWVILDEANRADMDKIFGGMLTWLSGRPVKLGRCSSDADAAPIELGWNRGQPSCATVGLEGLEGETVPVVSYLAGDDWRLLGTYNAVDAQRVFRFGQALGRRFARVPIPPMQPAQFDQLVENEAGDLPPIVRAAVKILYAAHFSSEQPLGPALFLAVLAYVKAGLGDQVKDDEVNRLITEGYLVHLGTWLARMEPTQLATLREKVVAQAAAIPDAEWEWLKTMLPSLA